MSYLNIANKSEARALKSARLGQRTDAVVLHTTLLSLRWDLSTFELRMAPLAAVVDWESTKIAFPQDEFYATSQLEEHLLRLNVSHVFSAAPSSEWPKIYPRIVNSDTRIHRCLTAYVDDRSCRSLQRRSGRPAHRPIALGYRAWNAEPWLGRLGQLKAEVGRAFLPFNAPDFVVDVSTDPEDTLLGSAWDRFLLNCRAIAGSGSGASILDSDGSLRATTQQYLRDHPAATFDEVEQACFANRDGELALNVVGPRHLEATAARTCQVLTEAEYSGLLRPDEHYVPIDVNLSNIDEVVDRIRDQRLCNETAARAHADVIASGRWTYRVFIESEVEPLIPSRWLGTRALISRPQLPLARVRAVPFELSAWLRTGAPAAVARSLGRMGLRVSDRSIRNAMIRARHPLRHSRASRKGG